MIVFWFHYRQWTTNDGEKRNITWFAKSQKNGWLLSCSAIALDIKFHRWMKTWCLCSVSICCVAIIYVQFASPPSLQSPFITSRRHVATASSQFPTYIWQHTRLAIDWYAAAIWGEARKAVIGHGSDRCWSCCGARGMVGHRAVICKLLMLITEIRCRDDG
jgi:hypothetical protein